MLNFFTTSSGKSPIKKYLDNLDISTRDKVLTQFSYLRKYGTNVAIPNTKKLNHNIWELRILGQDNIRILFAQIKERGLYVLHIFNKKTQKLPRTEIKLAMSRLKQVVDGDI